MEKGYLESEILLKISFYKRYAKINRMLFLGIQTLIVILAALTPIFAALEGRGGGDTSDSSVLTFTLISSSILAVLEGISRLFRFKNLWLRYRDTANNLINEVRKYKNNIGEYRDQDNAADLFKSNMEEIIQEEQADWYNSLQKE